MTNKEEDSSNAGLDEDTVQWRKILDLESAAKTELDWYSTKTFEAFLDALDINQPTTNIRSKQASKEVLKEVEATQTKIPETEKRSKPESSGIETILSAEALKILSELPDLSYMSSTRSFMFPRPN